LQRAVVLGFALLVFCLGALVAMGALTRR
jgi:hypothetical protein